MPLFLFFSSRLSCSCCFFIMYEQMACIRHASAASGRKGGKGGYRIRGTGLGLSYAVEAVSPHLLVSPGKVK
ncbi:hypothetical protein F4780DRAFT_730879 [Xylariomycetidae sp. FL0641]|nr:hypothetical protein F4780DRAFT_730879 [Xylariomycetidae sp. FL0641]